MVDRRRFLVIGLGVGSVAAGFAAPAGAAAAGAGRTVTLWRLSADWGYPVGPKGRTRCKGRACHLHAANKIYETEAAALAGRLHICCMAQPVSTEVPVAVHDELTNLPPAPGPELTDLRYDGAAEAWERAAMAAREWAQRTPPPAELAATGLSTVSLVAGATTLGAVGTAAMVISRRNGVAGDPAPATVPVE